jgi:adenosine deaminase
VLAMLRERGTVLEVCPSSNLNTRVLASTADVRRVMRSLVDHDVRFTVSTDGPEMLRSYLRNELQVLLRHEILSLDEVHRAIRIGFEATFLDRVPTIDSSVRGRDGAGNGRATLPIGAAT